MPIQGTASELATSSKGRPLRGACLGNDCKVQSKRKKTWLAYIRRTCIFNGLEDKGGVKGEMDSNRHLFWKKIKIEDKFAHHETYP